MQLLTTFEDLSLLEQINGDFIAYCEGKVIADFAQMVQDEHEIVGLAPATTVEHLLVVPIVQELALVVHVEW